MIKVDENGTLDLSMKKKKEKRDSPAIPTIGETVITTPESSLAKVGALQIPATFYRSLYEQEGWDTPLNFSKAPLQQDKEVFLVCHFINNPCVSLCYQPIIKPILAHTFK